MGTFVRHRYGWGAYRSCNTHLHENDRHRRWRRDYKGRGEGSKKSVRHCRHNSRSFVWRGSKKCGDRKGIEMHRELIGRKYVSYDRRSCAVWDVCSSVMAVGSWRWKWKWEAKGFSMNDIQTEGEDSLDGKREGGNTSLPCYLQVHTLQRVTSCKLTAQWNFHTKQSFSTRVLWVNDKRRRDYDTAECRERK